MRFLADTNLISEFVKPDPNPGVVEWTVRVDQETVFMSVVSLSEVRLGIELLPAGKRRERLADWLGRDLPVRFAGRMLPIDGPVAETWGVVMARSKRTGNPVSTMDAFLAAAALVHGLTLVTRNRTDFAHLGVELSNPWT